MTKGENERYRVQAAIAAMQGIISSPQTGPAASYKEIAERSNLQSYALMAELGLEVEND